MKKKVIIFSVLILCCVSVFAQNKMDKATFEHLVDYANCQYLMAFIEKNDAGKPYFIGTYEKGVKSVLQKAKIDNLNNVPDYNKIKDLFSNGSNNYALSLAEKINEIKGKYDSNPDNNSLIESLRATAWKRIDLTSVATKIQNSIRTKSYTELTQKPTPVLEQEVVKYQGIQTSSQVDVLQAKIDSLQQQYKTLQNDQSTIATYRLLVIICLIVIVLLIVALFQWNKFQFNAENHNSSVRKIVKNVFFTSKEINERFEKIQKVIYENGGNNNVRMFEDKLNNLERQFGYLQLNLNSINQNLVNQGIVNKTTTIATPQSSRSSVSKEDGLYFASKSYKQLTEKLPNSANANFKVIAINGNEAEFEYIGAVRNENWFEGVCSIENSANDNLLDKKQIYTTQSGKVRKENDNWVVITPAKIRFI